MEKNRLYIAGTGRAGTTFLVRYLTELGLETTLSRNPNVEEDDRANAGIEEPPHALDDPDLPYVVKSPWLYLVIDELLEKGTFAADAVIIPIRDLKEAATSRLVLGHQSVIATQPWMSELSAPWDVWATVPGGPIHSMSQIDEERLLAVGFHHLVERLVRANVPIVFLHFPRFANDGDYLFSELSAVLPQITEEKAAEAFAKTADPSKVRATVSETAPDAETLRLQNAALKREIGLLRQTLEQNAARQPAAAVRRRIKDLLRPVKQHIGNRIGAR